MSALTGSKPKKLVDVTPKKRQLEGILTEKADSGGFSHTHRFNDMSKPEKHLSKNAKAAGHHVAKSFGAVARGAEPMPDESAMGATGDAMGASTPMGEVSGQGA